MSWQAEYGPGRAVSSIGILLLTLVVIPVPHAFAISTRTLITASGGAPNDGFGYSATSAGDVNGDGYDDVIIGANGYSATTGRAYVYFGGPGADAVADWTLTGGAAGDNFGYRVAAAGDVNGDGYADVIVGAHAFTSNTGRAYIYFGGPTPDAIADVTFTGATTGNYFGYGAASAGDVNGDGYSDVVVGAYGYSGGTGRAYIYYGGPSMDNVTDLTLTGVVAGSFFGVSVSSAGDVNADGYGDVIVGAHGTSSSTGSAYIFYGAPSPDATPDYTLSGEAVSNYFGVSVSGVGDTNGDGFGDVIVGAYGWGGNSTGRAYVYYGGAQANNTADIILTGEALQHAFGFSVSSAGDPNRDGYGDFVVGAYGYNGNSGRAYVYLGGPGADTVPDIQLAGETAGSYFGVSVSGAGDVNGDGHDDLILGAYGYSGTTGRAYVRLVYPYEVVSPNDGETWVAGGPATVHWRGHDLADILLSRDGGFSWSTIASSVGGNEENVATLTVPDAASAMAKVRVVYRGQAATASNSDASDGVFRIVKAVAASVAPRLAMAPVGEATSSFFGGSVAPAGDVNGDGYPDFIVGDISGGGSYYGRAYIYFGGPGADAAADVTLVGTVTGGQFGYSVGAAGDVNGDGYDDVIVGARYDDTLGPEVGRAFVFFGGRVMDATSDLTLNGESLQDTFGASVGSAGDVNGDGYSDVIVGAWLNDAGETQGGRAYIYFGGSALDATPDWTLTGHVNGEQLGAGVGTTGDMNRDGFDDVIVGAPGGILGGRAYVYFGGPTPDAVPDVTMQGTPPSLFGYFAVGTAGDVNGDGFADAIVGASYTSSLGATSAGAAHVFYGGPHPDPVADVILFGDLASFHFGSAVATAGDVNEDGFDDVIVGTNPDAALGPQVGRAYVYYGGPSMDSEPDIVLTGTTTGDSYGTSVSAVGDLDGDGRGDFIVGANRFQPNGKAFVYESSRYVLQTPNGGETWNVGAMKTISWLGAEPADIWLSTDGGNTQEKLESNVGGHASNSLSIRVPHTPTKFARILLTPSDLDVSGSDRSDSLFTIQTSVALLSMLAAKLPQGGVSVTWSTNPGPEDLSGYRVERAAGGSSTWQAITSLTRETQLVDPTGGPGSRYRLFAVNGFGEELMLGESSIRPLTQLAAWPLPFRANGGGSVTISFATSGGLGGGSGRAEVTVFDVSGRLVRRIASGEYPAGSQMVTWDGRDERGKRVASGVYFVRSASGGETRTLRLSVLR